MDRPSDNIYLELLQKLVERSEETTRAMDKLDKKIDLHIQKTEYEFEKIQALDNSQNDILAEHIAGVNTLRSLLELQKEEFRTRLETLEAPSKWLQTTKNMILWIAALLGAVTTIMNFIKP